MQPIRGRRPATTLLAIGLAVALVTSACNDDGGSGAASSECGFEGGVRCAPQSQRVDLTKPSFSNPTKITNPLFPTSTLAQVIQLGEEAGEPARFEITTLPDTKNIEWNGQNIETLVRHYVAFAGRRVVEIAFDFFAQADDGSVWYFGEDVFNYEDGVVADQEGTWLAGKDGPPGLIMPARPKVGDVYRPENIPGLVFEEVTVQSTSEKLDGPRGPVEGGILTQEHLQDNTVEDKAFVPGYGEFRLRAEGELVTVALAVPIDAAAGPAPGELNTLSTGAAAVFEAVESADWTTASATVGPMTAAWETYRGGGVPPLLEAQMNGALEDLAGAVSARRPGEARQAALDTARASLDLQLRHRPPAEIDLARLAPWARQVLVDAAADNAGAVASDVAILEAIGDRAGHTLDPAASARLKTRLDELRRAADDEDVAAAAQAVPALLTTLAGLRSS
jgi:hypothetical protein